MSEKIAVLGLGYVGLPLMIGLSRHFENVIGFDIDIKRVDALNQSNDWTGEVTSEDLAITTGKMTANMDDMLDSDCFIITVPTPIDKSKRPDLSPMMSACRMMGELLKSRAACGTQGKIPLVVFESTVYPGLTEEICGPAIAKESGLVQGKDFKLGYSPERINPGDKVHTVANIKKIISAEDEESLDRLDVVYSAVITAGLHRATDIRVAETAKVIENTQRDINIALMNELAIICDRVGIRTKDVLDAAGTKWNFLPFTPGLVGGHCIGVDPYYLTARAEELGYTPQVILSGRRINDHMPIFIAQKIIKLLVQSDRMKKGARVGILGLSFKENVRDLRNSRVPEIVDELATFGLDVLIYDPVAEKEHAKHEYDIDLCDRESLKDLDVLVLAVSHDVFMKEIDGFLNNIVDSGSVVDIKSVLDKEKLPPNLQYWSL